MKPLKNGRKKKNQQHREKKARGAGEGGENGIKKNKGAEKITGTGKDKVKPTQKKKAKTKTTPWKKNA